MEIKIEPIPSKQSVSVRLDKTTIAMIKQIADEQRQVNPSIKDSDVYRTAINVFLSELYPKRIQNSKGS